MALLQESQFKPAQVNPRPDGSGGPSKLQNIFKRIMGFYADKKEILVSSYYFYHVVAWCINSLSSR